MATATPRTAPVAQVGEFDEWSEFFGSETMLDPDAVAFEMWAAWSALRRAAARAEQACLGLPAGAVRALTALDELHVPASGEHAGAPGDLDPDDRESAGGQDEAGWRAERVAAVQAQADSARHADC